MAQEDVEVVRNLHRAYERGDMAGVARYLSPDVTWRGAPPSQRWNCKDRSEVLHRLQEMAHRVPALETLELVDLGDEVLVGLPVTKPWTVPAYYQRVRVEDGMVVAIQDYGPRDAALAGVVPTD
jgi:SnoaL-like protein